MGDPDCEAHAKWWLDQLLRETGASEGFYMVEEPPPMTHHAWQEVMTVPERERRSGHELQWARNDVSRG